MARWAGVVLTLFEYYGKNQHLQLLSSPGLNGIHNRIYEIHPYYLWVYDRLRVKILTEIEVQ